MNFVIYIADCTGNKANCDYPHRVEVDSSDVLQEAVKKDHVCAEYNPYLKRGYEEWLSTINREKEYGHRSKSEQLDRVGNQNMF